MMLTKRKRQVNKLKKIHSINLHTVDFIIQQQKGYYFMVYITIVDNGSTITLNCHKGTKDGEFFQLVIDPITKKLIKRPLNPDIDASTAYSHVYNLMKSGEPLPKETVAAWG